MSRWSEKGVTGLTENTGSQETHTNTVRTLTLGEDFTRDRGCVIDTFIIVGTFNDG